jgi:hypothetical protein
MNNKEVTASEHTDRQTLASMYVLFTRQDRHRRRLVSVGIKCIVEALCCSQSLLGLARSEQHTRIPYGNAFHSRATTSKQAREGVFRMLFYFAYLTGSDVHLLHVQRPVAGSCEEVI